MQTNTLKTSQFLCPCPNNGNPQRNGCYFRKSDSQYIQRWRCGRCGRSFSQATGSACFNQNKRRINEPLRKLLCSGVSQRRAALILNIHHKTVARKFKFLAEQARNRQEVYLQSFKSAPVISAQFDEMRSFEHTKFKPLSIAVVVTDKRKILSLRVSSMPANGLLAKASRLKYGPRLDNRAQGMKDALSKARSYLHDQAILTSDKDPRYPGWLKSVNPKWGHVAVKGKRGCIVGQGELKKIGFDPIYAFNHTAAMIRANVNRLFRKTWCTTKKMSCLEDHLILYMDFHNCRLTD